VYVHSSQKSTSQKNLIICIIYFLIINILINNTYGIKLLRSGGVFIYEKEESSISLQSTEHDLFKFDKEEMKVKRISITNDDVS